MNSLERFLAAVAHRAPDRVPIDYQSGRAVGESLRRRYGASSEREILDMLGCDFYYLSARDVSQNEAFLPIYGGPELSVTRTERTCPLGIRFRRAAYGDKFGADESIAGPLEKAVTAREILDHPLPDPRWFHVERLLPECEAFRDKVIVGGFWTAIFGDSYRMHGFQNFLTNMAAQPALVRTLVERMTDFYLELNERLFSVLRDRMHVFFMGNDFGTQQGLLFHEDMWCEFFQEPYRRIIRHAKSYGYRVMVHSCGAVAPLIPRFIELGVDILDPVQTTARGMDPEALKSNFGDRIAFHGAADTQRILPQGTVDEVRRHAGSLIRVLGKDGGYIFSSCNSLQPDTPIGNIDALYDAARKSGGEAHPA